MATALDVLNDQLRRLSDQMEAEQRSRLQSQLGASPFGQSILASQSRLAMETAAQQSRFSSASWQAQQAYLATPQGQQTQLNLISSRTRQQTLQQENQAQEHQSQARFLQTPLGQQQLQAQYGARLQSNAAQTQQGTVQLQAQASHLSTAQGAAQYRQQQQAQAQQLQARETLARQQQIAQYGEDKQRREESHGGQTHP